MFLTYKTKLLKINYGIHLKTGHLMGISENGPLTLRRFNLQKQLRKMILIIPIYQMLFISIIKTKERTSTLRPQTWERLGNVKNLVLAAILKHKNVNEFMFYNFEPNLVENFLWESGFSNFGQVTILRRENSGFFLATILKL